MDRVVVSAALAQRSSVKRAPVFRVQMLPKFACLRQRKHADNPVAHLRIAQCFRRFDQACGKLPEPIAGVQVGIESLKSVHNRRDRSALAMPTPWRCEAEFAGQCPARRQMYWSIWSWFIYDGPGYAFPLS